VVIFGESFFLLGKYKKMGHYPEKNCRKILIIGFAQDTPKIQLHTTPSFNPTFKDYFLTVYYNARFGE
jgi:hypothetical protein